MGLARLEVLAGEGGVGCRGGGGGGHGAGWDRDGGEEAGMGDRVAG